MFFPFTSNTVLPCSPSNEKQESVAKHWLYGRYGNTYVSQQGNSQTCLILQY